MIIRPNLRRGYEMRLYKLGSTVVVGLICALSAGTASAQFLGPPEKGVEHGFQIERYEPTFAGESTFGVERPWYSSERWFSADFVLDEGHNPAWIGVNRGGGHGAIDDQFVGHLNLAASFLDRFLFGISFQETLYERRLARERSRAAPVVAKRRNRVR